MFEKLERQLVPAQEFYPTVARIQEALFREGQIATQQSSPNSWVGKGPVVGLGFVVKATIIGVQMPNGVSIDLKLEGELEDAGIIWLGVGWFVCFPVAAVLFVIAWRDASSRQRTLYAAAWSAASSPALPPAQMGWGALPPAY